jgi:hypothetical protein
VSETYLYIYTHTQLGLSKLEARPVGALSEAKRIKSEVSGLAARALPRAIMSGMRVCVSRRVAQIARRPRARARFR